MKRSFLWTVFFYGYSFLLISVSAPSAFAQITVNVPAGGDVVGAANQVYAAGGGTINLAAGNYYITGSILLNSNTTLNGAGGPGSSNQSVIYAPQTPNSIAMVIANGGVQNIAISNLVLDGNIPQAAMLYGTGGGNYAYNDTGIYVYSQSATSVGMILTNVEVRHTLRGILTGLVDNLTISGCYFHDNNPGGFSHNMYLVATSGVEIDHTRSDNALTGDGLHIDFGGYFYTIRKSEFSGNNGYGILSQQDNSVTVEDSKLDYNSNDGIQIDAGGLLLTRDQMNVNSGYGFNIPDTADGNGQVNGVYTLGDGGTDYFYEASINDFTIYGPSANVYPAVQATGVTGVMDTADWTLTYPGYTYMGAVDFNANHLTGGTITFPYVGATVESTPSSGKGNYPLVFRYSNGTSSAQTMNVSVNGAAPVALSFPATGSYSTWSTVTMNAVLNVGNSTVTMSVPAGATSAPEIDTLTVTTSTPNTPNAPTNLTGTSTGPYSIALNWTVPAAGNNNAAQTYTVYRNGANIASNITATSYADTRIFYGESTYSYDVVAFNQAGGSSASNSVTVTSGIDAPPGLQVVVSPGIPSNNLSWLGVSGAANYLVRRATISGGPYQTIATVSASTNTQNPSYSDTMLANGQTYYYVVAAEDASNNISANSYQVTALGETFSLAASASSIDLSTAATSADTITVNGTNGFSDSVVFSVTGLPTGVTAAFSPTTATSGGSTQLTLTDSTSSPATLGSYPLTVTGKDGGLIYSVPITLNVGKTQTITYGPVPNQVTGTPYTPNATASSGLPITYTVVQNGNCSVSGTTVTFLNVGACGVIANQPGNATYGAAAPVGQVITVNAGNPTIVFSIPNTHTLNSPILLSATSNSTGTFSYGVVSGPATVSGSTLTLTGGGLVTVIANQAASYDFNAGSQTATFTSIAGSVWLANGNGSLSTFDLTGLPLSPTSGFTGSGLTLPSGPQSMAFDASGNLWVANTGSTGISEFNKSGLPATTNPFTAYISNPTALAIDGNSQVWVLNGNGSLTVMANNGTVTSSITDTTLAGANAFAIDQSGSLWTVNASTNAVKEYLGIAAPTAPLANAVKNNTVGTKP
jgi:hypothetical protein